MDQRDNGVEALLLPVPRFNYVLENCMHPFLTFILKLSLLFPNEESIFSETHLFFKI